MTDDRGVPVPLEPGAPSTDDELTARITHALRSRESAQPDAATVAARIDAELAGCTQREGSVLAFRRGGRFIAAGLATGVLAIGGAGAAAAADPYSPVARALESAAEAIGLDWSPMPDGFTREQFDALQESEYSYDDIEALGTLWNTDDIETKARLGQLLLDGQAAPVPPGGAGWLSAADPDPDEGWEGWDGEFTQEQYDAYFDAGYTYEDGLALGELWGLDYVEVKTRAGQTLIEGRTLPIAPGSTTPEEVAGLEP